ncbi:MAG: hypothetical protein HDT14_05200 [Oscillibacter sp.]|nr:hypothetical protein [Oscillibacter sp.]
MKKYMTALLVLMTLPALMSTAHADVIAGPAVAVFYTARFLPWILAGAAVGVTVFLLRKFRGRKK